MWETGRRRVDHKTIDLLDDCYRAGGALHDLAWAIGTPSGLDSRLTWYHNFTGPSGPVWVWLRPQEGHRQVAATLYWGPARVHVRRQAGVRGIIVIAPASIANPPVRVELREFGWADFGRGPVPKDLGIPRVHAIRHARAYKVWSNRRNVDTDKVERFAATRQAQVMDALRLLDVDAEVDDAALKEINDLNLHTFSDVSKEISSSVGHGTLGFTGEGFRRLRHARGLSEQEAATLATKLMTSEPVDDNTIHRLETGASPRSMHVKARLDVLYGADGLACCEAITLRHLGRRTWNANFAGHWEGPVTSNVLELSFPPYWVGPIWITVVAREGRADSANVLLRWDPWQKPLRVRSGSTITTRCAGGDNAPLLLDLPEGWGAAAGVGVAPLAIDVQEGWSAIDKSRAEAIFDQMKSVWDSLVSTTGDSLVSVVRRLTR